MNVLIVDDSSTKISQIVSVIKKCLSENLIVETSLNSLSAQNLLKDSSFDIMIVDLCLPIRSGAEPIKNGGALLVQEIERKKSLISPKHVIGISQYEEYLSFFPEIWNALKYDNSDEWKIKLTRLIRHIEKSKANEKNFNPDLKPTLIVEGSTDNIILNEALNLFFPKQMEPIRIKSDRNAGAKWVSNQVVALTHSMNGGTKSKQKVIGLLDGDIAGQEAKEEIDRIIPTDSAMRHYFKIISLSPDYARDMIPLYAKGLCLPVSLEELFTPDIWQYSEKNNWLEYRSAEIFTSLNLKDWNKMKQGIEDYFGTLNLSDDNMLYLKKVKKVHKKDLVKYILGMDINEKKEALKNFKPLLKEIIDYLSD